MGDTGLAESTFSSGESVDLLESDAQSDAPEVVAGKRTEAMRRLLDLVSELPAGDFLAFMRELQERHSASDQADT